jgi:hypothetical protein
MLTAEARVETERSSRYLVQLCRHVHRWRRRTPSSRRMSNGPMTAG